MTLNQLGYFYQAAVLQHFNQAAEKMNISEPSLSRSISSLEDELGVTLFEKRGRNVILTKAGEIFLEHATQILDETCGEQDAPSRHRRWAYRHCLCIPSGKRVYSAHCPEFSLT